MKSATSETFIERIKNQNAFANKSVFTYPAQATKLVKEQDFENTVDFRCEFDVPKFFDMCSLANFRDSKQSTFMTDASA